MMGETSLMREDLLMCLYANLSGMAVYFPLLFRMKFRFTNRTLLCAAAAGVLVCNLLAPHITFLPLLWLVCFVEGMCKIQGTFECMSNIQLWMTPERDFTVFFQALSVFNMLHMVMGGVAGAAVYTRGLSCCMAANIARYGAALDNAAAGRIPDGLQHFMETFMSWMTEISIRQIYGWTAYACIFLFLLSLLYDTPVRRGLKRMPLWQKIRKSMPESRLKEFLKNFKTVSKFV